MNDPNLEEMAAKLVEYARDPRIAGPLPQVALSLYEASKKVSPHTYLSLVRPRKHVDTGTLCALLQVQALDVSLPDPVRAMLRRLGESLLETHRE